MDSEKTFTVVITGAAGQIGYSLIPLVCSGRTFGDKVRINLRLLDIEPAMKALLGVAMEIEDCAYPLLNSVEYGFVAEEMLNNADVVFFVGGFPRQKGMERKDLIDKNVNIFKAQGKALNEVGSSNCRVLVVANPANTNCLVLSKNAPNIPKKNFTSMTRLDHDRALNQIALRTGNKVVDVKNSFIWGNHSSTQYPDVRFATVKGEPLDYAADNDYYRGDFISTVQKRGAAIIEARNLSSAMSAANAASNHMRDWYFGSQDIVSMGVINEGEAYGVGKDLCFSFPIRCSGDFEYEVVTGLEVDEFSQGKIDETMKELNEEKELAEI
uniref:Malate dehydrogenase n=1 Tax=Euplotes harpa TaxID=151035 RepID=A0A7S3N543_9SPIT|mmetsp:Transcript_12177/g.13879  ORF Transcript_12177/g.13879 Transcript_12177/m.13879 type:complete len:326 (+) Transcript_12177:16-993(+)